jgi:hypothetical protein
MNTNTILILVGIAVAYIVVSWLGKASKDSDKESSSEAPLDLTPYQARKEFFNSSEQMFYSLLQQQVGDRYGILSKVRIEDIIESTDSSYKFRNTIKSRHIDFILLDKTNYQVKYAIELDGGYHNGEKAQQVDEFKNVLFHHVGIPLHRIKVGTNFAEEIKALEL